MGANHLFYVKTIETHLRAFLPLNILAIGTVTDELVCQQPVRGTFLLNRTKWMNHTKMNLHTKRTNYSKSKYCAKRTNRNKIITDSKRVQK